MSILYNVIINGKLLYICICNAVKEGDYERYNLIGTSCGECMKTNYEERKMNIMMLEENVNKELTRAEVVELLQNDVAQVTFCIFYTSDAADDHPSLDHGCTPLNNKKTRKTQPTETQA